MCSIKNPDSPQETLCFNVSRVDERYKIGKPLIVTTNQKLDDMRAMRQSGDADHKRIYDRVLTMCVPMAFRDGSRRDAEFRPRLDALKETVKTLG